MRDLSLTFSILEKKIDEKTRTVIAGVLQEDVMSANNRFYPASVVREAAKNLIGKRSLIGHDTNSPEDIVAKIERSEIKDGLVIAEFKFGTDPKSESIFTKIREGLVDSTSIRATGTTKRAKIGEDFVDVVETLEVNSVDWVVDPGISSAKVIKVFEQAPSLNYLKESEMTDQEIKELNKKLEESEKAKAKLEEEKKLAEEARIKAEKIAGEQKLNSFKNEKLSKVTNAELREHLRDTVTGNSESEIEKSFNKQIAFFEKYNKDNKLNEEIVIKAQEGDKEFHPRSVNELLNSDKLEESDKVKSLVELMK